MNILSEILQAERRIRPYILKTPLMFSPYFSRLDQSNVYFKLESEQETGSFKVRGATNKLLSLSQKERNRGVVTASTGNHGLALAHTAKLLNVQSTIYLPTNVDSKKADAIKQYGVTIEHYGTISLDTELYAKKIAQEQKQIWVSPYNDPQIIGGQGTIAIEIAEQLKKIDAIFVNIGGGGLISGIATFIKAVSPETKIIGCLPENSPEMYLSIKEHKYIRCPEKETLSDGSAGGFEKNAITYAICKTLVDDYVLISEEKIRESIRFMVEKHHKIIEGAAAVALAAFIKQKTQFKGKNVVIVICGSNIASEKLKAIL